MRTNRPKYHEGGMAGSLHRYREREALNALRQIEQPSRQSDMGAPCDNHTWPRHFSDSPSKLGDSHRRMPAPGRAKRSASASEHARTVLARYCSTLPRSNLTGPWRPAVWLFRGRPGDLGTADLVEGQDVLVALDLDVVAADGVR